MSYSAPFAYAIQSLGRDPYSPVVSRTTRRERRRRIRARKDARS
jgi:hypothetical protein